MSAGQILRASETAALSNNQVISRVVGKSTKLKASGKKGSFMVMFFITMVIAVFLALFSSGNLIPSAISERIVEETDVQYADAVQSKALVFQQALSSGNIPSDTAERLKKEGVLVGYSDGGNFVETNSANVSLSLKYSDKIVSANDFYSVVNSDAKLYNAFNKATYQRAAYYYDESAEKVFKKIGTTRDNYSSDSDFNDTMNRIMGEGSNVNVNNVVLVKRIKEEDGKQTSYYEYVETEGKVSSSKSDAASFINGVRQKSIASSDTESALYSAQAINIADTLSKEQRSSLFFLAFMENISKMKAGEGNDSKISDAMNYITRESESQVVDVSSGEIITSKGSPLQSPSLYSVLSGDAVDVSKTKNYASDRIVKTVENKIGTGINNTIISNTVSSAKSKVSGTIGHFGSGNSVASEESLSSLSKTVETSLTDNSFSNIGGIYAGEYLVEGAVNVGKELAKASGATASSADAAKSYARLTSHVIALDNEADRLNRSPFDITSKNTFLGSIIYKFAISLGNGGVLSQLTSITKTVSVAISELLPVSLADDSSNRYLGNFGECTTLGFIGAVGSAACSMIATFDTTTLDGIFNDAGFINFMNNNTVLNSSGVREVKKNSALARFISFNNERVTPVGITDGGILNALSSGLSSLSFVSDAATMIKSLFNSSEQDKRLASGAAFVNSTSNSDWQTYKYAQRYVSLARATESLRQYSNDKTAYSNIKYFEGSVNPVVAFSKEYLASR